MTVYVIQKQMHFDADKGELVPRFDLSSAEQFGQIEYLLSPGAKPEKVDLLVKELKVKLKNFSEDDYLLLVGNPILIGIASAIASSNCGTINFLQWFGKTQSYVPIKANIFIA